LGVELHTNKTRVVHIKVGFEFFGFKIKCGNRPLQLSQEKILSGIARGDLYA